MTEQEAMEVLVTLKGTGAINGEEIEAIDVIDEAILELEKYRAIGTLEECMAAVEKQEEVKNKAIDDFANTLKEKYSCLGYIDVLAESDIDEIAEQLKAGDCD